MSDRAPIYTFDADLAAPPPSSGSVTKWLVIAAVPLFILGVIIFGSGNQPTVYRQEPYHPQPYHEAPAPSQSPAVPPVSRPTYTVGTPGNANAAATWKVARVIPCPIDFKTASGAWFVRCQAIDLPANGAWVRRDKPQGGSYVVPDFPGIDARGCSGEIHALALGNFNLNTDCGFTDFRSADGHDHVYYEGILP